MTIAKEFMKTIIEISENLDLTNNAKFDIAWKVLNELDFNLVDHCSGSTSEYEYIFNDGSKIQYLSFNEGYVSDISFNCEEDELSAYFMTEYEDFDDWDYNWIEEE